MQVRYPRGNYRQNLGRPGAPLQRAAEARRCFATPCDMGRKGNVSKRADSRYKADQCLSWVKVKNPASERQA